MYKVSLNSRITKQRLAQASRALSTGSNPRQGGMSKLLVGGLVASAASYAYYQRYQKDNGKKKNKKKIIIIFCIDHLNFFCCLRFLPR